MPATEIQSTTDAAVCLDATRQFLESDPVRHNVILTLLETRITQTMSGSYLWAREGEQVVAVAFHSPAAFNATVTPMPAHVVEAVVDHLVTNGSRLPGVTSDAATAARFAGQWTERTKSAATPLGGQRIYEASDACPTTNATGQIRCADDSDSGRLVEWLHAFGDDTGETPDDPAGMVARRVAEGGFWLWESGEVVSMAAQTRPVAGITRIQAVYTPPEQRCRGYAGALVSAITANALGAELRPILYTDLANPTSNSLYRQIGYRAVEEVLRYRFET